MAGMILNTELLLDQPGDHGRCPDAIVQTIGDWAAVKDVCQLLLLLACQLRWPSRSKSFQQTVHALGLILLQPLGDP
jgi:hypothetical protein